MKYEYLNDSIFLKNMDLQRTKEQFVKITVLDWDENPIQDIQGKITGGSLNLDGSSSIRRTANLTFYVADTETNVTNVNHLLAINKKVALEIGFKNVTSEYKNYDIIWYPLGIYVVIQSSLSHSTSGTNISLQLKDKMCLLNGECGGTLPASVTFSEIETFDGDGNTIITYPTIYQIIQEAVNHFGGEQLGKIIISDIDTRIKKVMKWIGATPVYLYNKGNGWEMTTNENYIMSHPEIEYKKYANGEDVGYIYTDFVYPGEDLIGDAGSTVCDVLDKIKNTLGNYEYFYDLEGNFVFQEIKNYLNTSHSTFVLNELKQDDYIVDQSKGKAVYTFDDSTLITSYSNNPQFNQIKNDFIVWGIRKTATGAEIPIRYHLAIDTKPQVGNRHRIFAYEDPEDGLIKAKATMNFDFYDNFPRPGVPGVFYYTISQGDVVLADGSKVYVNNNPIYIPVEGNIYQWDAKENNYVVVTEGSNKILTSKDWRTELYLQGVDAEPFATDSNYYYTELQSEWPKLYDIWDENPGFYEEVLKTPSDCDYFLDFIDSSAAIGEFSISNIGRRTKVLVDNDINCLFSPEVPDWIIIENNQEDTQKQMDEAINKGQTYALVNENIYSCLGGGGARSNSAYDAVRNLLYQYTSYNENINIQCIPIFHLDVNTRVGVIDPNSNIYGDYIIHTISIPLDISSTMTISATRALERF